MASFQKLLICLCRLNFRSNLIKSLIACGYKVIVLAPKDKYASQLASLGCQYLPLKMDVTGKNPINDPIKVNE